MKKWPEIITKILSIRLSLLVVCEVALLLLTSLVVMFYFSRQALRKEELNNAEQTLEGTVQRIDNILLGVEQLTDNVYRDLLLHLDEPDRMFYYSRRIVECNPYIVGCAIVFKPYYYPDRELFMAYVHRKGNSLSSDGNSELVTQDTFTNKPYTQQTWYTEPMTTCKACWTNPLKNEYTENEALSTFCLPILDQDSECVGVIAVDLPIALLSKIILDVKPSPNGYATLLARNGSYIVHPDSEKLLPRGMLEPWSMSHKKWKKKLGWWLYQRKDVQKAACVYATAMMEAEHVTELGITTCKAVIPNGIETDAYPCKTSFDVVRKQVLFLGRIHVKKGIEILFDAWKRVYPEYPEWQLLVVGNGEAEYKHSLENKAEILGLKDCIKILPPMFGAAKTKIYHESAIFCLPSYSENFGMTIAESMSCGTPVITTTNCPWEILDESKIGWCVDLSVDNIERALREAMTMTPTDLYEMGQQASKLINENYDYRVVTRNTLRLYKWLLNSGEKPEFIYD